MRPERIDQVVPSFGLRDAIGTHVLHLRQLLRDLGFASDIWCVGAFEEVRSECHLLDELLPQQRPGTWWLYHLSNGSPAADIVLRRSEPLLVDYHNITPGSLFEPWVDWAAESSHEARQQLKKLAARSFFSFADSAYNASELTEGGFVRTLVVPPLFDPTSHAHDPDAATLKELESERTGGGADWLFVGRVAPPKAQHDLIKAFACFRRLYDPLARLHLVGTWMGDEYPRALMHFADRLGLGTSVRLPGPVSDEVLCAYYATADVFVSASDHEGFFIPMVEAMQFGLPVVAYAAGAVPETAESAALVLADKSPLALSTAVARVIADESLRRTLVELGRARAEQFSPVRTGERWRRAVEEAVASSNSPSALQLASS
jgi:glycosyltransferase involved in cell wall biosynthesis